MARLTRASPGAPPPSLILRRREPGPIGSVAKFARRSWPGSTTIRVHGAEGAGAARKAAVPSAARSTFRAYRLRADADPGSARLHDRRRRRRVRLAHGLLDRALRGLPEAGAGCVRAVTARGRDLPVVRHQPRPDGAALG